MNKEEKYNQLREEIIKENKDIVKLKFGCKIITTYPLLDEHIENKHIEHIIISSEIDKYNLKRYIIAFKNKLSITADIGREDIKEIIGRPITLEDCLIAIEKKIKTRIKLLEIIGAMTDEKGDTFWKFNVPLQDQSDECKELLFDLIVKR